MTALDDARAAEQEALHDAETAKATAAALQERLAGGDATVTPEQLDDAWRFAKWARIHAKGVAIRRERADADDAIAAAKAVIDQAADITELDAELVDAWRSAVIAISALVDVAQRRTATVWENHGLLNDHREQVATRAGTDLAALGALPALYGGEAGYRIPDRGIAVHDVRPAEVVTEAVVVGNAGRIDLSNLQIHGRHPLAGSALAERVTGWSDAARELAR